MLQRRPVRASPPIPVVVTLSSVPTVAPSTRLLGATNQPNAPVPFPNWHPRFAIALRAPRSPYGSRPLSCRAFLTRHRGSPAPCRWRAADARGSAGERLLPCRVRAGGAPLPLHKPKQPSGRLPDLWAASAVLSAYVPPSCSPSSPNVV